MSKVWQENLDETGEEIMVVFLSVLLMLIGVGIFIFSISDATLRWKEWTIVLLTILSIILILVGMWWATLPEFHYPDFIFTIFGELA